MYQEHDVTLGRRVHKRLMELFPERQVVFRSEGKVSFLRLNLPTQLAGFATVVALGGWLAWSTINSFAHEMQLAVKDAQIADVRLAYRSLMGDVAEYQLRFSTIVSDLETNHASMVELARQNSTLQEGIKSAEGSLSSNLKKRKVIEAKRDSMAGQLVSIETQMASLAERNFSLKGDLSSLESGLQMALSERNAALLQSTQMRRDIKMLENQLVQMEETENATVLTLTEQTDTYVQQMERVIEMAGLDVGQVLEADDSPLVGQGGPFIAIRTEGRPSGRLKVRLENLEGRLAHSESLQSVMSKLPLAAPMKAYHITSKFGKRRDPINKRWSMHYGLDFGGPINSKVYATAPGKVITAGRHGNYGNFIEIDHGAGIRTRFGHLNKILVKKGDIIAFGDKIGLLGNTGRSTGPHLHYEMLFKGRGVNPMNFIKAGRHVFQEQG